MKQDAVLRMEEKETTMPKMYNKEQTVYALSRAEGSKEVGGVCREVGVS